MHIVKRLFGEAYTTENSGKKRGGPIDNRLVFVYV